MNSTNPQPNLQREILSGTFWTASGQVVSAVLRFGIMLVLARLLLPEFFGLLGMSMVVMLILRDVSDMGFGAALVQRETIDEIDKATVFWFNLAMSILIAGMLLIIAGWLAQLLGDARLEPILRALVLLLPVNALVMVPQAVLRRELKFAQLAWRDAAGMIGFGLVGIPLALLGAGVWSLIGAFAGQWISRSAFLWMVSPYRPTRQFAWERLRLLSGFSVWMFLTMLMGRIMANVDYFFIGRFLGATALGYYTLAFQLVIIPVQRITGILSNVLFPSFARIQTQIARLQKVFLEALKMLIGVLAPISAFLFISADLVVPLLYSEQWLPAVPVVRLLALASFFYGLDLMNALLIARGKPNWRFLLLALRAGVFIAVAWGWGLTRGIEGVAISILVAVALSTVLQTWVLQRELRIRTSALFKAFSLALIGALTAAGLARWSKSVLSSQSEIIQAMALVLVFGGLYSIVVLPGYHRDLKQILAMARRRQAKSSSEVSEVAA